MAERLPPSPARLRRALAAGDNPLSPFSVRVASLVAVAALTPALARAVFARFDEALRAAMSAPEKVAPSSLAADVAWLVAPLLVAAGAVAFAVGVVQTGLAITRRPLPPVASRLFSAQRLVDALRHAVFAAALVGVSAYTLTFALPLLAAHTGRSALLLTDSGSVVSRVAWTGIAFAAALAAADIVLRRAAWLRALSPSPEEARRERRETEGAPEPRRARRRAHEELARGSGSGGDAI